MQARSEAVAFAALPAISTFINPTLKLCSSAKLSPSKGPFRCRIHERLKRPSGMHTATIASASKAQRSAPRKHSPSATQDSPGKAKDGFRAVVKRFEDAINSGMEAFVTRAPEPVVRFVARLLFYPTLYWNKLMKKDDGVRRWYDVIVPGIILGALPERKILATLRNEHQVDVFLNTVREWPGLVKDYTRNGLEQVRVPMTDFAPPKLEDIEECVTVLRRLVADEKKTVYVHCKAGRGRSASVVMAYLMKFHGMTPLEAQRFLEERRPHVLHVLHERDVIKQFQAKHDTPR